MDVTSREVDRGQGGYMTQQVHSRVRDVLTVAETDVAQRLAAEKKTSKCKVNIASTIIATPTFVTF